MRLIAWSSVLSGLISASLQAAAVGADWVGTHKVYDADGTLIATSVLSADGTFSDAYPDKTTASGRWEVNSFGQLCFDTSGNKLPAMCWMKGDIVEGRQSMKNAAGETVFIVFQAKE